MKLKLLIRQSYQAGYSFRSLMIAVLLAIFVLPFIGIFSLRIVETLLHRTTEAKLLAEAAYLRSLYLQELHHEIVKLQELELLPRRLELDAQQAGRYITYKPVIDPLCQELLPPAKDGRAPSEKSHELFKLAGERLQPLIKKVQRRALSAVRILDPFGTVIATSGSELDLNLSHRREVAAALEGQYKPELRWREQTAQGYGFIGKAGRVRLFCAVPVIEHNRLYGVVYLSRTSLSFIRDAWDHSYSAMLLVIFLITIMLAVGLAFVISRPIRALVSYAQSVKQSQTQSSIHMYPMAPQELHQLAQSIQSMVEKLKQRVQYTEEFTRNLSHELKTPLTGIQGAVEILQEDLNSLPEKQQQHFLKIIAQDSKRMGNLVRRLLSLSRMESAAPVFRSQDIVAPLQQLVSEYQQQGFSVKLEQYPIELVMNIELDYFKIICRNLIENALHHGQQPVELVLTQTQLCVVDYGEGISHKNQAQVFQRFFTTARKQGNTGLGLTMVKTICELHDWRIQLANRNDGSKGLRVCICWGDNK